MIVPGPGRGRQGRSPAFSAPATRFGELSGSRGRYAGGVADAVPAPNPAGGLPMGLLSLLTGRGRPRVGAVNIGSPEFKADPFPYYAKLRAEAPVCRVILPT